MKNFQKKIFYLADGNIAFPNKKQTGVIIQNTSKEQTLKYKHRLIPEQTQTLLQNLEKCCIDDLNLEHWI
ncbi:hypothetical protein [Photobacterium leiognathi]|uniref:hypothetical protein n=1 Tax=Photobacterium leiognathi TaxID=553611 RepID=UPI002981C3AD|nr:hypothetical protein [Photobacterium leiognathi]